MSKAEEDTTREIMGGALLKTMEERLNIVCWLCWNDVPIAADGKFSPHIVTITNGTRTIRGVCAGSGMTLPAASEARREEAIAEQNGLLKQIIAALVAPIQGA